MEFEVEQPRSKDALKVKVEQDGNDVDIVVTDKEGHEHTIAYLNSTGLTVASTDCPDIERDGDDRIEVIFD